VQVSVLCENSRISEIAEILFANTTTAGVRHHKTDRIIMNRDFIDVIVKGEDIRVKRLYYKGTEKFSPEWGDCERASAKLKLAPMEIYHRAKSEALKSAL